MSVADLLLTVRGQDDRWLSMTPDRTYFEAKYQPRVNRSRETYEVPFDNQSTTFGSTGRCTIPVKGDYMTRLNLRTVMPPIYQTVPGQYVFPTPSSEVSANVYVNMGLTKIVGTGTTLSANTTGNHYFSVGAPVILTGTGTLNGTFTIASIPTANSFTCSTSLIGTSTQGTVSSVGIVCADNISYFSTQNSNLWTNNLTNKTWKIINASLVGNQLTLTTSSPSNFAVGSQVVVNMSTIGISQQPVTVTSSTDTTFSYTYDNTFAMVSLDNNQAYSTNGAYSWTSVTSPLSGQWNGIGFGHGTFVAVGLNKQAYSSDGKTWTSVTSPLFGNWRSVAWSPIGDANGTFAMVCDGGGTGIFQAYSTDSGRTWTPSSTQISGNWTSVTYSDNGFIAVGTIQIFSANGNLWFNIPFPSYGGWNSVAYGNGVAIAVGFGNSIIRSSTPTYQWNLFVSPPLYGGTWNSIAFGNGTFVIVGGAPVAYSTNDGASWTNSVAPPPVNCTSVTFGNGVFVATAPNFQMYSTNGISWTPSVSPLPGFWQSVAYNTFFYGWSGTGSPDSVSLVTPPIQVNDRSFTSTVYPSISFATADDAAFWGFDSREGFTYSLPATPPWTYTQSGWIAGFLPPATSTYDDSVAHKLCKAVRILVGKQTIKEYSGEYIELQNDLLVPYENKAILKLMNGTLDQTQAVVSREYYVNLPIGTKEVPLCALTNQHMSIEVDFEQYQNLSHNLNPGTGAFTDAMSYVTYANQALNARSTLSYQRYIFIVTYDERLIVFDTTKDISSSFIFSVSGSRQLCIQAGYLYIGLLNGLGRAILSELIQGNISSYTVSTVGLNQNNNGSMISDFRYIYMIRDDPGAPNIVQYDTTSDFNVSGSYVFGYYYAKQLILTGSDIIMIPNGQPGKLYTYKLNADFSVQWYPIDYSMYGYEITEGVLIGNSVYFICDGNKILEYSNSTFTVLVQNSIFVMVGSGPLYPQSFSAYSVTSGRTWTVSNTGIFANWQSVAFGNGVFVTVGYDNLGSGIQAYSLDNGQTWTDVHVPGIWLSVAFGNGVFVMTGNYPVYSLDNGKTWIGGQPYGGTWYSVAFGNGVFVMVGPDNQAYSLDNGQTWSAVTSPLVGYWYNVAFGNGVFVMVGQNNQAYSLNNGQTWTAVNSPLNGTWISGAFGNDVFVMVGQNNQAYSLNNGKTWTPVSSPLSGNWSSVVYGNGVFVMSGTDNQAYSLDKGQTWTAVITPILSFSPYLGVSTSYNLTGTRNLMSMGDYIYASADQGVIRINVSSASIEYPAPVKFDGSTPRIFAHGPRYVYMFTQGSMSPTSVVRYDPYAQISSFQASILVDYESLPPEVPKPDKALLGLVQTQKVTDMKYMNIKGPVKELWVTGVPATTNVFQYSNLATRSTLELTGEQIVTEDIGTRTFLNIIEPFETHTSMPIRNVSVVSFEFDPEREIPNGTINFSRIRDQVLSANAQTVWARTYNLLTIQDGIGGLIFNS